MRFCTRACGAPQGAPKSICKHWSSPIQLKSALNCSILPAQFTTNRLRTQTFRQVNLPPRVRDRKPRLLGHSGVVWWPFPGVSRNSAISWADFAVLAESRICKIFDEKFESKMGPPFRCMTNFGLLLRFQTSLRSVLGDFRTKNSYSTIWWVWSPRIPSKKVENLVSCWAETMTSGGERKLRFMTFYWKHSYL